MTQNSVEFCQREKEGAFTEVCPGHDSLTDLGD